VSDSVNTLGIRTEKTNQHGFGNTGYRMCDQPVFKCCLSTSNLLVFRVLCRPYHRLFVKDSKGRLNVGDSIRVLGPSQRLSEVHANALVRHVDPSTERE
jgi:hypothetical protein